MSIYFGKSVLSVYDMLLDAKEHIYRSIKKEYPQLEDFIRETDDIDIIIKEYKRLLENSSEVDFYTLTIYDKLKTFESIVQDICVKYNLEYIDFNYFDVDSNIGVQYYDSDFDRIEREYIQSVTDDMCFKLSIGDYIDIDDIDFIDREDIINRLYEM